MSMHEFSLGIRVRSAIAVNRYTLWAARQVNKVEFLKKTARKVGKAVKYFKPDYQLGHLTFLAPLTHYQIKALRQKHALRIECYQGVSQALTLLAGRQAKYSGNEFQENILANPHLLSDLTLFDLIKDPGETDNPFAIAELIEDYYPNGNETKFRLVRSRKDRALIVGTRSSEHFPPYKEGTAIASLKGVQTLNPVPVR